MRLKSEFPAGTPVAIGMATRRNGEATARFAIQQGAELYNRKRVLWRLLPACASELPGEEPDATQQIVQEIENALRLERQRGKTGSWTYDLNRHLALAQACRAERAHLARLTRSARQTDLAAGRQDGET